MNWIAVRLVMIAVCWIYSLGVGGRVALHYLMPLRCELKIKDKTKYTLMASCIVVMFISAAIFMSF